MTKTNFILTLSVLVIAISCNRTTNKDVDEVETFQFPKITDRFKNDTLELTSEIWLNYGDHTPYYFGKLTDSVSIERYLRPMLPPPGADTSEWNFEPKEGKFDEYFLDWMDNREFKRRDSADLFIKVDTTQIINNNGRKAFPVLIQNKSIDTIYIGYGSQIPIITEAKTKNGEWKPIEERFIYMCGNGLHSIILPPNELVITSELIYTGNFKTKLRLKMGNNYSEEFNGTINETQFESEWDNYGERKTLPNKVYK
ncbi:MAG: hypothetical protein COA38_17295 [Fluviicola sp.]|nr:MAG: hypothetical protein COA38_17295 [Fluviicola sp.]